MSKIRPFSNLSEFEDWMDGNCYRCPKYNQAATIARARCKLAFSLDFACVDDGEIELSVAEEIGCELSKTQGCVNLHSRCNHFGEHPPKRTYKKKVDKNQTSIF